MINNLTAPAGPHATQICRSDAPHVAILPIFVFILVNRCVMDVPGTTADRHGVSVTLKVGCDLTFQTNRKRFRVLK